MAESGKKSQAFNVSETRKETVPLSPKEGFNTNDLETPSEEFATRVENNRSAIFFDLKYLKNWGYNLDEWQEGYASWLSINDDYDLDVVRVFYSNLSVTDITDDKGNVTGISFTSQVRGQKIQYDDSSLNTALGIKQDKYRVWEKHECFSEKRYNEILGLEGSGPKSPADMCDEHRLIHMVYSRLVVNKAGIFTNLTEVDNPTLGRLIGKMALLTTGSTHRTLRIRVTTAHMRTGYIRVSAQLALVLSTEVILPADQAARKAEHARLKAEIRAAQPGMSSKKAKRLDKYIETKLKKAQHQSVNGSHRGTNGIAPHFFFCSNDVRGCGKSASAGANFVPTLT